MGVNAVLQYVLGILFPAYCLYCKEIFEHRDLVLCKTCMRAIQPVVSYPLKISDTCTVPVFSIGIYKDPLRRLIVSKQYRNRDAARALGVLVWQLSDLKNKHFDCIVPVPLHWTRYAYRWYNQAHEMGVALSKHSGKPVIPLLKRSKRTVVQAGLSKEERTHNVKHVFSLSQHAHEKSYRDATIVIIDDVMTTGSTILSAVKTLRLLKPKEIVVVVACRVI